MARHLPVLPLMILLLAPTLGRAQTVPTPEQFFGFKIGADGELATLSEDPRVLYAAGQADRPRQVRGARQDDAGQRLRAAADQRAAEPGPLRPAGHHQSPARRSAWAVRRRGAEAGGRRQALLPALRHHPLDRGLERSGDHPHRPPPGHRLVAGNARDARERGGPAHPVGQSRRAASGHRPLVQDQGHALRARLSGPVPQVRRPRRQPRLVHADAEGNAHERRAGAEQVPADHLARHAPARPERLADLRAAVHRSVRRQHPSDPGAGPGHRRPGDGDGAGCRGQGRRRLGRGLRHVDAGAAVHGLPRPAAHPDRDRQLGSEPRRSVREPTEGPAARPAGVALELPGSILEGHVDARPADGLRRHRRPGRYRRTSPNTATSGSTTSTRCTATG